MVSHHEELFLLIPRSLLRGGFINTMRQRISRLVRDTLAFSKKLANHIGAIKYFICHYNPTRPAALLV